MSAWFALYSFKNYIRETKSPVRASRIADPEAAIAAWAVSASGRPLLPKREDFDSLVGAALQEDASGGKIERG